MCNILITGANGQLGHELQALAADHPNWTFHFTDREELDITRQADIGAFFENTPLDYCINCAAYTAVDQAESEAALAEAINTRGPEYLAAACHRHDCRLLHISTDYVYHNDQNRPLLETDACTPRGVYARTKRAGEQAAVKAAPDTIILRTSWIYSSFGHNFLKTMLQLGKKEAQLRVVDDQIGAPTYAGDLAASLLKIIATGETPGKVWPAGIYNYSNEGVASWYDFALAIFALSDLSVHVTPIPSSAWPTPAERPPYSVLNKEKIKETFELSIPYWRNSLKKCLTKL